MSLLRQTIAALGTLAVSALLGAACLNSDEPTGSSSGGSSDGGIPDKICLLHNCTGDVDCQACSDGRTTCLGAEHRCVACDAASNTGCPSGKKCSPYGNCVEASASCPVDKGLPTITCNTSADCAACDPAHQVCNTAAHKCVACTDNDTSGCQSTDA